MIHFANWKDADQNLDFEAIRAFMVLTDWGWHGSGPPSVGQLRDALRGLFETVVLAKVGTTFSSGGFSVRKVKHEDGPIEFVVVFDILQRKKP